MLTAIIILPAATALAVLAVPGGDRAVRVVAIAGAVVTFALTLALGVGFEPGADGLAWRDTAAWIPPLGASYDVAVTGLSLPLVVLTALLTLAALVHPSRRTRTGRLHPFLFLLMETGLLGVFCAQDLLLFYLFFEIGLVPMYFIIGVYGHEDRGYAALKFFLYTRLASLAMLLAFLALYLSMQPHTFSIAAIAEAAPLAGGGPLAAFAFFALLLGFAIKIPAVPVHNWLPDAHVEAPAEGSAILAGVQLKMGGYGLVYVLLRALPAAAERYAWVMIALALVSLGYGALAALGQRDLKRLIAFTSVNHMGYVLLAAGVWGVATDPAVRTLAVTGATYQMVSHGLLTGAMFLMVGVLQEQGHTRQLAAYGGLARQVPIYAALFTWLAFGSLGIPGMSGFIAELQVIGATASVSVLAAVATALSLLVTTGLYLRVVGGAILGAPPDRMPRLHEPAPRRLATAAVLAALSVVLGVAPGPLVAVVAGAVRALLPGGM